MTVIKKEIRYLFQKSDADSRQTVKQKEQLVRQGYLAVTIIEGPEDMQKGLWDVVKNHL